MQASVGPAVLSRRTVVSLLAEGHALALLRRQLLDPRSVKHRRGACGMVLLIEIDGGWAESKRGRS